MGNVCYYSIWNGKLKIFILVAYFTHQPIKGMDLPYVRLAVQWRATCDMCDLWQRFGRVARTTGTEGTGILFHEKSHLDESRERKMTNAQNKKRKADKDAPQPAAKRLAGMLDPPTMTHNQQIPQDAHESETVDPTVADRENKRPASYAKRAQNKAPAKKAKGSVGDDRQELEICGPLDDFINASTRSEVKCQRAPVKLYFDGPIRIPGKFPRLLDVAHVVTIQLFRRRPPSVRQFEPFRLHALCPPLLSSLLRSLQPRAFSNTLYQPSAQQTSSRTLSFFNSALRHNNHGHQSEGGFEAMAA